MTRSELVDELLSLPEKLFNAEAALLNAEQVHRQAREALADREASLLIEGVAAKNAEMRSALLRERTESLRAAVEGTRATVEFLRLAAERERARFGALRATARLLAVDESGMLEVMEQLAKLTAVTAQANTEVRRHIAKIEEDLAAHAEAISLLLAGAGAPVEGAR